MISNVWIRCENWLILTLEKHGKHEVIVWTVCIYFSIWVLFGGFIFCFLFPDFWDMFIPNLTLFAFFSDGW